MIGGHTPAAFRRAVEHGQGWYGFALDPAGAAECLDGLRRAGDRYERPAGLGELEITVTPRRTPDVETAGRFRELGVHRLVLWPRTDLDEDALAAYVARVEETLIGRAGR